MTYCILFLVILYCIGPALWSSGTIVALDYIPTPYAPVNWLDPLFIPLLNLFTRLVGTESASRIFFVVILMLAGYLGVLFARWVSHKAGYTRYIHWLEIFGGLFFIINPFIYERMIVQPSIALGMIFLGYGTYFLLSHRYVIAGAFSGLALMIVPHTSYMIALIFGLYFLFFARSWYTLYQYVLAGMVAILINLNWILAPFFGHNNLVDSVSSFSEANLEAFRTQAVVPLDVFFTNALLYGFWGERYHTHIVNTSYLSSYWYIAGMVFLFLVVWGVYRFLMIDKKFVFYFGILGILSLIFGVGIASSVTAGLTHWMIEHIPLWQGYREPQKWIGLLMIVEGIGFIMGVGYLFQRWGSDRIVQISLVLTTTLICVIWSPGALWGYHGQLRTIIYPPSFEDVGHYLLQQQEQKKLKEPIRVLSLPWHGYIGCVWTNHTIIANPSIGLLGPIFVLSADNIEVGDILYSNSQNPQTLDIEQFLRNGDVSGLKKHKFTHIFLMRSCADSFKLEPFLAKLERDGGLAQLISDKLYRLYQIR